MTMEATKKEVQESIDEIIMETFQYVEQISYIVTKEQKMNSAEPNDWLRDFISQSVK